MKAYQPRFSEEFLRAVVRTQRWLAGNWYPCARPLAGPAPLTAGRGLATAETMVDDPGVSTDRDLVASAAGLAWLVRYTDRLDRSDLAPHPLAASAGERYPVPHSPLFDFERDTTGAAWIDELADVAVAARAGDRWRRVIGHTDWSARNVRWDRRGVQAVFDLDSVAAVPDSFIAGQAAVTWATTMDVGEAPLPDPARIGEFLDVYHLIREEPIKGPQIRAAWGSALWVLCYTARCEHAMDRSGAAVERLRRHGDELAQRASDGGSAGSV